MFRKLFYKSNCKPNPEFERTMASIPSLSQDELDEMHEILLTYAVKCVFWTPEPLSPEDYLQKEAEIERTLIGNGGVFGCKTYGEARRMNEAIVKRLDELER